MADSSTPTAEERLVRRVIARFRCAYCHRQHSTENVSVMGRYDSVWIVGVDCDGCRHAGMFVVSMRRDSFYERITDLTEEEQDRFLMAKSIEPGDVDSIRHFLEDFKGDFSAIFGDAES